MSELLYTTSCVDSDDDGYDSPPVTEDWTAEYNERVALLDHRWVWSKVVDQLVQVYKKSPSTTTHFDGQARTVTATIGGAPRQLPAVAVRL